MRYSGTESPILSLKTVKFYGKLPHFTKKEYEENYEIGLKKDCNIFVPKEYLQDYKNALGTDYMNIFAWNPTNINQEKVRGIMAFSHDGVVSITGLDSGEVLYSRWQAGWLISSCRWRSYMCSIRNIGYRKNRQSCNQDRCQVKHHPCFINSQGGVSLTYDAPPLV